MGKIFLSIIVFLFFCGSALATPDEVDLSGITVPGWTITAGRGIDDSGDYIVFWGDGPHGEKNYSVFYDADTGEVTDFGISDDISQSPLLVWGITSNGTVVCGFDKEKGTSWLWQPGIGFTTITSDVTDYDIIHASAINQSKTVVGYLECTNYPTCSCIQAFYKNDNQDIVTYQYPGGYNTELYSIPDNGKAIGRTMVNDGECIFEYNVNNDNVTDLSGTCDSLVDLRIPNVFGVEEAYADDLLQPGIPKGTDHSQIHASNFSEICYSHKGKIYIWNTETDEVKEMVFPGYEEDYLTIGGFSSGGTMIVNVEGKESFISRRITNIPFDMNWSWFYYSRHFKVFNLNLNTIPFDVDVSDGDVIPIEIEIKIGNVLNNGYVTKHEFNGKLKAKKHRHGVIFEVIEE
jgi:hypothetical protein